MYYNRTVAECRSVVLASFYNRIWSGRINFQIREALKSNIENILGVRVIESNTER